MKQLRYFLAMLCLCLMLSACSDDGEDSPFGSGSGTAENPYQITTIAQLNNIRDHSDDGGENYLGKHFILMNDLDFNGYTYEDPDQGWLPIGGLFSGSFNGQNHVIRNLRMNRSEPGGLFEFLYRGTIKNLGLEAVNIKGTFLVGGLVGGNAGGTISNSYATGRVSASGDDSAVGGLVGSNDGFYVGLGFASFKEGFGTISNCYASVEVAASGESSDVGGLVGANREGTISNSYATGTVSGYVAGGLVGLNWDTISSCYATGAVSASRAVSFVGGLVGFSTRTISNSYATGSVSGDHRVGGLVGFNNGTVETSYATGRVSSSGDRSSVGGLVGQNFGGVSSSYSTGMTSASGDDSNVGGLVGTNESMVENSYATGMVSASGASNSVGGLVGFNNRTVGFNRTVENSYATGMVSASGASNSVGGLVGGNVGTVENSYWNTTTSGQTEGIGDDRGTATGVAGLTSAEMYVQSNFMGWDFSAIWQAPTSTSPPTLRDVGGQ